MNSKILIIISLLVLFSLTINFVLAETANPTTITGIPTPKESPAESYTSEIYQQQKEIVSVLIPILIIISILIGIFSIIFMIRKSPKIPNLIIYGLMFLLSIVYFITVISKYFINVAKFGWIVELDFIGSALLAFLVIIFSGYLIYSLIKKENFAKRRKYALSLSSGGIISSLLVIFSLIVLSIIFPNVTGEGAIYLMLFTVVIGSVGSIILSIVGFFIDKSRRNSNK